MGWTKDLNVPLEIDLSERVVDDDSSSKFQRLLFSKPLDVHKWSEYPEVKTATKEVYDQFLDNHLIKNNNKKLLKLLRELLIDLWSNYNIDPKLYTVVSLNKNNYKKGTRYSSLHISYRPLVTALEGLIALGYIEYHCGWRNVTSGKSYRTRIKATTKLINLINGHNVQPYMINLNEDRELIIQRNEEKEDVAYEETLLTASMRNNLRLINQHLLGHVVDLYVDDSTLAQANKDLLGKAKRERKSFNAIDIIHQRSMHRVFNDSRWDRGGRFYGGWWEMIPKKYRPYISIDGRATIELDYSGLHTRLLYHLDGMPAPSDPYDIYGSPDKASFDRSSIKWMTNIMINSPKEDDVYPAYRNKDGYRKTKKKDALQLMNDIKAAHPLLSSYYHSGKGSDLMAIDSQIAEEIMLRAIKEYKTIVLPVHDSFICIDGFSPILQELMVDAYLKHIPKPSRRIPGIKETIKADEYGDVFNDLVTERTGKAKYRNEQLQLSCAAVRKEHNIHIETIFDPNLQHEDNLMNIY